MGNKLIEYFNKDPRQDPRGIINGNFSILLNDYVANIFLSKKEDEINYEIEDNEILEAVKEVLPSDNKDNESYTNASLIYIMRLIIQIALVTNPDISISMPNTGLQDYIKNWKNPNNPSQEPSQEPTTSNINKAKAKAQELLNTGKRLFGRSQGGKKRRKTRRKTMKKRRKTMKRRKTYRK